MFDRLKSIAKKATEISPNSIVVEVVKDTNVQRYILDLNRVDQLFLEGSDVEGVALGKYSLYTELINERNSFTYGGVTKRKTRGEHYFLFDSGDFFKTFKVKIKSDGFAIFANEILPDGTNIFLKFGDVIGLTDENKTVLARYILPNIREVVRRNLLR